MNQSIVVFHEQRLELLEIDGRKALTAEHVGKALEYPEPRKRINEIFNRHREEFEADEDFTIRKVRTVKGDKDTIIFFQTGVNLIGMFSKQPLAKEFRRWAKKILVTFAGNTQKSDNERLLREALGSMLENSVPLKRYVKVLEDNNRLLQEKLNEKPRIQERRKPIPFTQEDYHTAKELLSQGLSQAEVARRMNRSTASISYIKRGL